MLTLTQFPLEPGCEDYSFLDEAILDLEDGLDSTLSDPINTPEQEASFDEADAVYSSVCSRFLYMESTHSDISKLQFTPSTNSQKLLYQSKVLLLPVPQSGKISASNLIHHFPIIQQHLDFRLLCHQITSLWSFQFSI